MGKSIGLVSTRFAGTDGVSLEAGKWSDVFEAGGHHCYWFAGELDRDEKRCFLVPEAHFKDDINQQVNNEIFGKKGRTPSVTGIIHERRNLLKKKLYGFIEAFGIDLLVVENALTLPMQLPLGLALTETIAETGIPTICHHHDFYWERVRYSVNAVGDYLRMAFPPNLPNIQHVVINSEAREQLALRTGIAATIIPNVLDFDHPPEANGENARGLRELIGLEPEDRIILQPTRIVQRKGIEHAIELVKALEDPRCKLVISHDAGDEGFEYAEWLKDYACEHGVDLRLVSARIQNPWRRHSSVGQTLSLWELYPHADFITYPSLYEGFGNAFLEAVYFKKPLLINRYEIFVRDIEPLGFDLVLMDGYLSRETIQQVRETLDSPKRRERMVNTNYEIATRHYAYGVLRNRLNGLLSSLFSTEFEPLAARRPRVEGPEGFIDIEPFQVRYKHYDTANCPVRLTGT